MGDGNFRDRMRAFSGRMIPPPGHPDHARVLRELKLRSETDLRLRIELKKLSERLPAFVLTRNFGGSGFPVANTLRQFFYEYFDRFRTSGPESFPTSFNVVESFLSWSSSFVAFDLREEREHLLRLDEYVDWYTSGSFPDNPAVLREIMPEGVAHCYNLIAPLEGFALHTIDSELRVLGLALIRHGSELSAMMVAGESPAFPPDEEAGQRLDPSGARKPITSHPSFNVASRYLPELPTHSRVIMLARFDIERARYDVRYVNLDVGPSFRVITDDRSVYDMGDSESMRAEVEKGLERYGGLFSALTTMIYLPAFALDQAARIVVTKVGTELHVRGATREVRDAVKILGAGAVPFFRSVGCLSSTAPDDAGNEHVVKPPEFAFQSSGYWRAINAGEVGEDKDGRPIVGKTWVERNETWTAKTTEAFVLSKSRSNVVGPDPGFVYVLRSGSHAADLYKIGLTRRSVATRAAELSAATGVPTGFEELARWSVGDCGKVEAAAHSQLSKFRVSKRREFFRVDLLTIIDTITRIVKDSSSSRG